MNSELPRQALAVIFVLVLAILAARKFGGRKAWPSGGAVSKELLLLERIHLTPQHILHRVRTPQGELFLVSHAQGVTVVAPSPSIAKGVDFA